MKQHVNDHQFLNKLKNKTLLSRLGEVKWFVRSCIIFSIRCIRLYNRTWLSCWWRLDYKITWLLYYTCKIRKQGLPNKNIFNILGYPLIAYSVIASKLSKKIDRTIVSTDSEKYAKISMSMRSTIFKATRYIKRWFYSFRVYKSYIKMV